MNYFNRFRKTSLLNGRLVKGYVIENEIYRPLRLEEVILHFLNHESCILIQYQFIDDIIFLFKKFDIEKIDVPTNVKPTVIHGIGKELTLRTNYSNVYSLTTEMRDDQYVTTNTAYINILFKVAHELT